MRYVCIAVPCQQSMGRRRKRDRRNRRPRTFDAQLSAARCSAMAPVSQPALSEGRNAQRDDARMLLGTTSDEDEARARHSG